MWYKKKSEMSRLIKCVAFGIFLLCAITFSCKEVKAEKISLKNPQLNTNDGLVSKQKVTYDCIWFGTYPQSEVITSAMKNNYAALPENAYSPQNLIVSDNLYYRLQKATGWNNNGDITIDGYKYRRIKKENARKIDTGVGYYQWSDATTYHYFRYEPIKWRVLEVKDGRLFLLSDMILDALPYHLVYEDITWEQSTLRSWLNGYGADSNKQKKDYFYDNFIGTAFSTSEKVFIMNNTVVNSNSLRFGTNGGNNTNDRVFLLSESEIYSDAANKYGFTSDRTTYDEARRADSSIYAKAMGCESNIEYTYKGKSYWLLRSPGYGEKQCAGVYTMGCVDFNGYLGAPVNNCFGVRPALNLDILSDNWTNAGTVSTDGNVNELKYTISYYANGGSGAPISQMKYYDQTLKLSSMKPVRSGYTFLGWSTNKTATNASYNAGSNYTLNKNTVLYAVWKKNEKKSQAITVSSVKKIYGDKPFYLKAKTNGNGKLSYSSNNKKVATITSSGKVSLKGYGSAKITVKASATTTYKEAIKTVTVKVVPKKIELKSVSSPSKAEIKISWNKDKSVSGYQIYLCARKDFKKGALERKFGKNTATKSISHMPSKKKYYVKVRAFKTVGKIKYYGAWSNVKSVKVK